MLFLVVAPYIMPPGGIKGGTQVRDPWGDKMKRLTAKLVDAINEPGKYHDGDAGLYLYVQERKGRLRKSYMQRVTVNGKRVEIGLGSTKWTTPSEARAAAQANRKIARTGGDPRRKPTVVPTLEEAADAVIAIHASTWKDGGKTEKRWRAILATYTFPRFGRKSVAAVTTADVLAMLVPHWATKRETMRKLRHEIGAIMRWAVAQGFREDNPAGESLGAALPKASQRRQHQRALPHAEVAGAIAKVQASEAWSATKLAFEFLTLTATRSGEVRGARWSEVDLPARTWVVPADRMKSGRDHRVPLSGRAVAILEAAKALSDGEPESLIFPSVTGRMLSDSTMSKLVRELGIGCVPHGMRSSFREWAAERTNIPREVAEEALAHVNPNKVESAYQRSDLFDRRRELMNSWTAYLAAENAASVPMQGAGR